VPPPSEDFYIRKLGKQQIRLPWEQETARAARAFPTTLQSVINSIG